MNHRYHLTKHQQFSLVILLSTGWTCARPSGPGAEVLVSSWARDTGHGDSLEILWTYDICIWYIYDIIYMYMYIYMCDCDLYNMNNIISCHITYCIYSNFVSMSWYVLILVLQSFDLQLIPHCASAGLQSCLRGRNCHLAHGRVWRQQQLVSSLKSPIN